MIAGWKFAGRRAAAAAALASVLLALAGCASSQLSAQWSDPQFAGKPARGDMVLVACQAPDLTLRRVCVDQLASRLGTLGALPVPAPDPGDGPAPDDAALLQVARQAGAAAVRGFGGTYRSGGGIGIGVAAPLGGAGPADIGYAASAALTDVASGRLMWSGRASAAPSRDAGAQRCGADGPAPRRHATPARRWRRWPRCCSMRHASRASSRPRLEVGAAAAICTQSFRRGMR